MIGKINKALLCQRPLIKYLATACALAGILSYPLEFFHFLAVFAHGVYESIAFVCEHWLTHVLHFSKFQAQLMVFYTSCLIAAGIIYRCIRRLPFWLRRIQRSYRTGRAELQAQWQSRWEMLPALRKIQLLLLQFALVAGSLSYMLA